jgi:nitrogen fixation protein FixH
MQQARELKPRELTGRHVLAICVGAFGLIIGVNLYMAWQAVGTFPGLEAKSAFVVSQSFDADRAAQVALGWRADTRLADGTMTVHFAGGGPAALTGTLGRATSRAEDVTLTFARVAPDLWSAPAVPGRGQWVLYLTATAPDGTPWRQRVSVAVR